MSFLVADFDAGFIITITMTTGGSFMQNQQPSTLKEIRVHGTQDFPCAFYQTGTRIKGIW